MDEAGVKFYDGCLIVEVHDHRSSVASSTNLGAFAQPVPAHLKHVAASKKPEPAPEVYRIVLGPTCETLWTDLSSGPNQALSDEQLIEVEARILAMTQPALCLEPTLEVTRIANHMIRATTLECPESGRGNGVAGRKRVSEEDLAEQERAKKRERQMRLYDETYGRAFVPT